jgi:hypothetical protein
MHENELRVLGWKSANEGISLDELRSGIAYNATYIGDLSRDEQEILEEGFMAFKMGKKVEEVA